jgi:hypothetical protein
MRAQQGLTQRRTGVRPLAHIPGIRRPPLRRCPARSWCDGSSQGSRFSVCSQAFLVAYVQISCFVHRTAAFGWAGSGGAFSLSARGAPASRQCFARLRRGPGALGQFFCTFSRVCLLRCIQQPGVGGGPQRALHSVGSALLHGRCTAGPRARMLPCSTAAAQLSHARACCQPKSPGCRPRNLLWERASRRARAAARSAELSRHAAAHCWPLRPCCLVCLSLEFMVFSRMHALAR